MLIGTGNVDRKGVRICGVAGGSGLRGSRVRRQCSFDDFATEDASHEVCLHDLLLVWRKPVV